MVRTALFVAIALIAAQAFAQKPRHDAIRLLIVDGQNNHDWPRATKILKEILEGSGRFKVDVSTTPTTDAPKEAWARWRPGFKQYDVVLNNFNGGHLPTGIHWPREVEKALEDYVGNGGGLVIYHAANNSFPNWPAYNQMIGLGWRDKSFGPSLIVSPEEKVVEIPKGEGRNPGHGPEHDFQVTVLNTDHPITKGMPKKWMHPHEQLTHGQHGPARNMTVLTYAWSKDSKENEPMDWVIPYGKGRVYTTMLGHLWKNGPDTAMRCVGFQTLLIRGCEWAATGKATYPVPKDFPTETGISLAGGRQDNALSIVITPTKAAFAKKEGILLRITLRNLQMNSITIFDPRIVDQWKAKCRSSTGKIYVAWFGNEARMTPGDLFLKPGEEESLQRVIDLWKEEAATGQDKRSAFALPPGKYVLEMIFTPLPPKQAAVQYWDKEVTSNQANFEIFGGPGKTSVFESTTKKAEDQVDVETKDGTAIFTFRCPTGIGGATIKFKDGKWPEKVVLRLRLKGLEFLTLSNGKIKLSASVLSHSGNPRLLHVDEDGKEKKIERGSPYWTEIRVLDASGKPTDGLPGKGGYFEVPVPKALLESAPENLDIEWIDFYRG